MKKQLILMVMAVFSIVTVTNAQTMKVQTKTGDKVYSISDVDKITFGKKPVGMIEMVLIPAGTFQMGNSGGWESAPDERPVHQVTITKPFLMGKYEVTQKQYLAVIGVNPSAFKGDSLPVEVVSWTKAVDFCNKLSVMEGLQPCYSGSGSSTVCDWNANGYRLPTEAEWEYACKAGTTTDMYNGSLSVDECTPLDPKVDEVAWYCTNAAKRTHPGGQKQPNAFGLYDILGNVWEWCWDWIDHTLMANYPDGPVVDPRGPDTGDARIFRGGSWYSFARYQRSSYRTFGNPMLPGRNDIGFRVVRNM